jgi:hypothetical protein
LLRNALQGKKPKPMKTIYSLCILLIFTLSLNAQVTLSATYKPATGDAEMDGFLTDVNASAKLDLGKFKLDLSAQFNVTGPKIDNLLLTMAPGDVYMTLQIGQTINKPVDDVKSAYEKNRGKGWGVIAKQLGIKPGSAEFHALKKSMKKPGKTKETPATSGKGNGKGKKK